MLKTFLLSLLLFLSQIRIPGPGGFETVSAGGPTVTYIGGCVNSAAALTVNCTASPNSTAGNILVAVSKTQNSSGTAVPTFVSNSGPICNWVQAVPPTPIGTGNGYNATVYTCILPTSAAENVKITWTGQSGGTFTDISVSEWHSTATWNSTLLDRAMFTQHATSTTSCGSGTTPTTQNANDLLVGICENFNNAETWGTLSGWTNRATSSRNTTGIYSQTATTKATQAVTIPLSAADMSGGFLIALQASNAVNCSGCALVQFDNSAGSGHSDFITLSGVVPGNTLVYYTFHNNWSGTGTTNFTDSSGGGNVWFPCNTNTGGGASVNFTDLQLTTTSGMSCFYSIAVAAGGSITGEPLPSDCSVSCSFVGGILMEFSGIHAWEAFSNTSNSASSTTSPNNLNCGSLTTTTANDFILCGIDTASGTPTSGTTPLTFPAVFNSTNGSMEAGVWSSTGTTSPTQSLTSSGVAYGGMAIAFK